MRIAGKQFARLIVTVALLVASVVAAANAFKKINFYETQISARHQELDELKLLSQELSENQAAYEWLQQQERSEERLDDLIKRRLSQVQADVVLRDVQEVGDRWRVHRYDVRLERVSFDSLSDFLVSCENARPPVRITELQVSAQKDEGGKVMAQLSLAEIVPADIVSRQ